MLHIEVKDQLLKYLYRQSNRESTEQFECDPHRRTCFALLQTTKVAYSCQFFSTILQLKIFLRILLRMMDST